jgi:hypothetical protein
MVWVFRNDGVEPWPPGTRIVFVDGSRMDGFVYANVAANPGEQVAVVQELRAPAERGVYTATWRLVCSAGYFGGERGAGVPWLTTRPGVRPFVGVSDRGEFPRPAPLAHS